MFKNHTNNRGCHLSGSLFLFLLLSSLITPGCHQAEEESAFTLFQPWFAVSHTSPEGVQSEGDKRIVSFYADGTYTMFRYSSFSYGKWKLTAQNTFIAFEPQLGLLETAPFYWQYDTLGKKQIQVTVFPDKIVLPGRSEGTYILQAHGNKGIADPFALEMHSWRLRPDSTENLAAIRKRVLNYLSFLESLYKYAIDNELEQLYLDWFPQPVQMHFRNGVRMAYADEIADWQLCFYDSAQAVKGYRLLSGAMQEVELKKTESRFERNLDCVRQLKQTITTKPILTE